MEFWPEFLASSFGKELVAGGVGGMAGVLSGHPLDTVRVRLQQPAATAALMGPAAAAVMPPASGGAVAMLRSILASEGPGALYGGMAAALASVTFQNAMVFQVYATLSRAFDPTNTTEPPSYRSVAMAGVGTGALQSLMQSPVELVKIRLQLQTIGSSHNQNRSSGRLGPVAMAKDIFRNEGLPGIYRGFLITVLRDAPAHAVYFWMYEYAREKLHPGCRKSGEEGLQTMMVAGGLAGVASWVCCYPLDMVKSRLQAQTRSQAKYLGIVDCFRKSVKEEGLSVLFRGLGTTVARAFVVNGAIFSAYELALRYIVTNNNKRLTKEENWKFM